MSDAIKDDFHTIKKLIREVEAISDEALMACSKLKLAMVKARQNPEVSLDAGQRAIMRLTHAETQAIGMSNNLMRVHDELSKVARVYAAEDTGDLTEIDMSALTTGSASADTEPA